MSDERQAARDAKVRGEVLDVGGERCDAEFAEGACGGEAVAFEVEEDAVVGGFELFEPDQRVPVVHGAAEAVDEDCGWTFGVA